MLKNISKSAQLIKESIFMSSNTETVPICKWDNTLSIHIFDAPAL